MKDAPFAPLPLPSPKRQAHPAGRLQCESGYRLQQLERRTRTSWHREAKLKWLHVAENDLTITNTLFRQADMYKTTWMHPRSKQWHLIDYVICRCRDIRDVRITRTTREGVGGWGVQSVRLTTASSGLSYRCTLLRRIASLLYSCETWALYRRQLKQLERFHMHSLRTILNIKCQDRVSNLQVFDMAESTSIEAMVLKNRLRWVGHVIHMEDNRSN